MGYLKTLVNDITGRKDYPIFNGTSEQIKRWVENNLDRFNLNEAHNCEVSKEENQICITGDEDYQIYNIIKIEIKIL